MTSKARLRISGLVRAQRRAEEVLIHGLPPAEIQAFQAWTAGIVSQVEAACRQYQLSPEDLPGPSMRAYQFLKSLDTPELTQRLAQNSEKKKKTPKAHRAARETENGVVRLKNLISIIENLQQMLYFIIQANPARDVDLCQATKPILAKIQGHVKRIEAICREAGSSPQKLPDPSLRAYHWLRFLSEDDCLNVHVKALHRAALQVESLRPKFPARLRSLPVEIRYYNLTGLYRSQVIDGRLLLAANEAFIGAPPAVMESMLWAVLLPKQRQKEPLAAVRQFADTQAFTDLAQQVNSNSLDAEDERSRGRYHDLKTAFQRVNRRYFKNHLTIPRLVWGQRLSRRKLGHYQPATDTVLVSRTLDNPEVPEFVVDFIVYHELLHKQLGIQAAGGRRYSHTPAFKQAERRFQQFQEAQEFLNGIGENLDL
jgi:hypothetical protein